MLRPASVISQTDPAWPSFFETDTRGKPRVDDRRVISGIVHVLKYGGRWLDAQPHMVRERHSITALHDGQQKAWSGNVFHSPASAGGAPAVVLIDTATVRGIAVLLGAKAGTPSGTITRVAARTTKIHALTDAACRSLAFLPVGGMPLDRIAGELLLRYMPQGISGNTLFRLTGSITTRLEHALLMGT